MAKFPTIKAVAAHLSCLKLSCERGEHIDVRLQVIESKFGHCWYLHTGDPSYDQDHRGYWGASYLSKNSNCKELARELIEECKEMAAQST